MMQCLQRWLMGGLFVWFTALCPSAHAQVNSWTNSVGNVWQSDYSWSLGVAPTNTQSATFITNAPTKTVTINSKTVADLMTVSNLTISAPVGSTNTLFLSNVGSLTPLIVLSNLVVNSGGAVKLTNSALVVNNRSVGVFAVDGALTLNGDSSLVVSGRIEVARATNGTLTLNSGTVSAETGLFAGESAGATGTVWVTGGQMIINGQNGSVIGGFPGGIGRVTVSNGTLQIAALFLSRSLNSESVVTVAGGTLILRSFCNVGGNTVSTATGTVWVTGGQVIATNITIDLGIEGPGRMFVSNGVVRANTLNVGHFGILASKLIVSGGELSAVNLVVGNNTCANLASASLTGGQIFVTNAAHNATLTVQSGTFTQSGGTLTVDNLVISSACARFIHTGGVLNGTISANSTFDSDGDGIPNGYEDSHGFDKLNPADASADSDGDGLTNLQEYLAGTDPTNSASAFRIIGVTQEGDDVRVTWTIGSTKTNTLQATAGDASGSFTNGFTDLFTVTNTTDTVTNYLDLGGATNFPSRFYRVRLVP